jgi:hypothetical protein
VQGGGGVMEGWKLPSLSIRALAIQHRESEQRIRGDDGEPLLALCTPGLKRVAFPVVATPADLIRAGDPREWLDARPPSSSSQRSSVKVHTASQASR